jgi:hypothetical protein
MKIKDYLILAASSVLIGYVFATYNTSSSNEVSIDLSTDTDTMISVKGKVALFIGDSHTANVTRGWQTQLSDSVGFKMINAAVSGKTTYWMLNQAVYKINDNIDYCFIYGGANDMYGNISPRDAIENIKGIVRICNVHNVKCIVLTGFDPVKCTRTKNINYPKKYSVFQNILLTENIEGATIVDTRVVDRRDCWDILCHMAPSGHRKIANKLINDLKLKKVLK